MLGGLKFSAKYIVSGVLPLLRSVDIDGAIPGNFFSSRRNILLSV